MKKTLGKKAAVQSGTLVAFGNCDCNADCRMLGCDCTPNTSPSSTLAIQNYAKLMTIAINGKWAF